MKVEASEEVVQAFNPSVEASIASAGASAPSTEASATSTETSAYFVLRNVYLLPWLKNPLPRKLLIFVLEACLLLSYPRCEIVHEWATQSILWVSTPTPNVPNVRALRTINSFRLYMRRTTCMTAKPTTPSINRADRIPLGSIDSMASRHASYFVAFVH